MTLVVFIREFIAAFSWEEKCALLAALVRFLYGIALGGEIKAKSFKEMLKAYGPALVLILICEIVVSGNVPDPFSVDVRARILGWAVATAVYSMYRSLVDTPLGKRMSPWIRWLDDREAPSPVPSVLEAALLEIKEFDYRLRKTSNPDIPAILSGLLLHINSTSIVIKRANIVVAKKKVANEIESIKESILLCSDKECCGQLIGRLYGILAAVRGEILDVEPNRNRGVADDVAA